MEIINRRMVSIPNSYGEEEGNRMNPDSSAGIYITTSVEYHRRLIAQNGKMKKEDKIKNIKVNSLKREAHINQRATLFVKLFFNLPKYMMASEDPSTPLLLQLLP